MIPNIDPKIGISVYSTDFEGTGGKIKVRLEDFEVVEAISKRAQDTIQDSKQEGHAVYLLRKRGIDTRRAISDIFARKRLRLKPLGLKDAAAVTEQFVCCTSKGKNVDGFSTEGYTLKRIGFANRPITKKDMISNHFKIRIAECVGDPSLFDGHGKILNFYGYQRFGSGRTVTHLIGKAIVQRDFQKAVDLILSFRSEYDSTHNDEIRKMLSGDSCYTEECLQQVPVSMDIERIVLKEMITHCDPLRALRAVPLQMRRFYVQAYQSYMFNMSLGMAFQDGEDLSGAQSGDICFDVKDVIGKYVISSKQRLALPLVGYSYYKKTRFNYQISKVLEQEQVAPKDFYIKEMQEASNEGGFRQAMMTCFGYSAHDATVEFSLSRGSFATMLLREVIKPADPILAGF